MQEYTKFLLIRLAALIIITPLCGYVLMRSIESLEKIWKAKEKKKKWLAMCIVFFVAAIFVGWLR